MNVVTVQFLYSALCPHSYGSKSQPGWFNSKHQSSGHPRISGAEISWTIPYNKYGLILYQTLVSGINIWMVYIKIVDGFYIKHSNYPSLTTSISTRINDLFVPCLIINLPATIDGLWHRMIWCLCHVASKECFAFFDEARSRGADLKLAMTARAMVTRLSVWYVYCKMVMGLSRNGRYLQLAILVKQNRNKLFGALFSDKPIYSGHYSM